MERVLFMKKNTAMTYNDSRKMAIFKTARYLYHTNDYYCDHLVNRLHLSI